MRRKKGRSLRATISIDTTSILLATIISLSLFAYCSCDDVKQNNFNKLHSASGHVKATTPITRHDIDSTPIAATNDTRHINYEHFINNQTRSDKQKWQAKNTFVPSGNELWDGLIGECLQKPSFPCFQKNVYSYLDSTLKLNDVNVTERIQFKRIDIDPNVLVQMKSDDENEISSEEGRSFESGMISMRLMKKIQEKKFTKICISFICVDRITTRRSHRRHVRQIAELHDVP